MTAKLPPSNTLQASLILAGMTTDGAGSFTTPLQQRGTISDAAGTLDAWELVDPVNGRCRLTLGAPIAGQNAYIMAMVQRGAGWLACRYFMEDPQHIGFIILDDAEAAINLNTTVMSIQTMIAFL